MSKATRRFIVNKILEMLITLVVVTLISFLLVRLSPVDPAEAYARRSFAAFSFTDEQMEALREDMGLNDPLPVQYVNHGCAIALHLDFGESFVSGQPVFEKVTTAIGITVTIVLISAVVQAVFILLFGCLCYLTRKRMIGHALIFLCIAGVSIPSFFFASTYLDIFAVKLGQTSVVGNTGLMRYLPRRSVLLSDVLPYSHPCWRTILRKRWSKTAHSMPGAEGSLKAKSCCAMRFPAQ